MFGCDSAALEVVSCSQSHLEQREELRSSHVGIWVTHTEPFQEFWDASRGFCSPLCLTLGLLSGTLSSAQQAASPAWQGQTCPHGEGHSPCSLPALSGCSYETGQAPGQGKMTHVLIVHGNISQQSSPEPGWFCVCHVKLVLETKYLGKNQSAHFEAAVVQNFGKTPRVTASEDVTVVFQHKATREILGRAKL